MNMRLGRLNITAMFVVAAASASLMSRFARAADETKKSDETKTTEEVRTLEFHTEKVGEAMHWMPEKVEVKPGEKVKFVIKHETLGGADFHGFYIRELDIMKQIDRNKTVTVETTIPTTLKPGEYKVTCQFHPKHVVASMLVVKADAKSGQKPESKTDEKK